MQYKTNRNLLTNLKQFLLTGALGDLGIMPTRQLVETLLGSPSAIEDKANVVPNEVLHILYYENVEITYMGNNFFQLAIYFKHPPAVKLESRILESSEIEWYQLMREMNLETFKKFLVTENIPCRKVLSSHPIPDDGITIEIITSGIWISFNEGPLNLIDSIFHTPSRPGDWQYESIV